MSDALATPKPGRKPKSLDAEIAAAEAKLRKLQDRQKEQQKKERDKNQKAVLELIKAEKLDTVSPELWSRAMPKIKALLTTETVKPPAQQKQPGSPAPSPEGAAAAQAGQ